MSKTVLVAGGAGFIGSYVCEQLLERGATVTCFDNLLTGSAANIEHLLANDRFAFIEGDILGDLPAGHFDEVWNLACPASPPHYQADPVRTMLICVVGTKRLLDLVRESGGKFFQASTSEIYGDPDVHPQVEGYRGAVNTIGPRACYDEGKRAAETLCFDYHRTYGVAIKVARIFNTYGPRMDPQDGRVVSNFVVRALRGEDLEIYGDGAQTRSFCYRDDLVDGFFRLLDTPLEVTGPVNLGNPVEFTVRELADLVREMTGSTSALRFRPLPEDDPRQRRPDIDRARTLLNWEPKVSLRSGLEKTIAYFAGASLEPRRYALTPAGE